MNVDLIADEIVKRIVNADTRHRIINAVFAPVPVDRKAIRRPLQDLVKASCPVSFKIKMIHEVERAVIASLKEYGIKIS